MARYPLSLPTQLKQDAETLADSQGISLNQFVLWAVAEKVGDLRSQVSDPAFPRIAYRQRRQRHELKPVLRGANLPRADHRGCVQALGPVPCPDC
ncbi:MAG: hypothetical protein V9H69_04440 [Anaerolineae bacterium]